MKTLMQVLSNTASPQQIEKHLRACDASFVPPLSGRVDLCAYAHKIWNKAQRYEAWDHGELVGLAAMYCNEQEGSGAFLTSMSTLAAERGRGIAARLVASCVEHARSRNLKWIELEVSDKNAVAVRLYEKHGFSFQSSVGTTGRMRLCLEGEVDRDKSTKL